MRPGGDCVCWVRSRDGAHVAHHSIASQFLSNAHKRAIRVSPAKRLPSDTNRDSYRPTFASGWNKNGSDLMY